MKIKTISKKRIMNLENEVNDAVYVAPGKVLKSQDLITKRLIDQKKKRNRKIAGKRGLYRIRSCFNVSVVFVCIILYT